MVTLMVTLLMSHIAHKWQSLKYDSQKFFNINNNKKLYGAPQTFTHKGYCAYVLSNNCVLFDVYPFTSVSLVIFASENYMGYHGNNAIGSDGFS